MQYSTVQYSTVHNSTAHYSTVQFGTVQFSTVQYSHLSFRDAAPKKRTIFGIFPKLRRAPPNLDHLGALFRSTFIYIFFYHPTDSEGSRVEFMRYGK